MTCVIVLGVPRSGTSAVAGLLHTHLGVNMGSRLMPPMPGVNDKGFFEDLDFVDLHVRMLHSHEDPRLPEPKMLDCRPQLMERYRALVRSREQMHPLWGVKDPKLCFLLPYFLNCLTTPYVVIETRRSFLASVESMRPLYGGMTLDQAVLRVGRYRHALEFNLRALKLKGSNDYHLFDYDLALGNSIFATASVDRVIEALGLDYDSFSREQLKSMASWFDSSLRRH